MQVLLAGQQRVRTACGPHRTRHTICRSASTSKSLMALAASHTSQHAKSELQQLCAWIKQYAEAQPTVTGYEKLLKRAQNDLAFVCKLNECGQQPDTSAMTSTDPLSSDRLRAEQLQGVQNNIRGMRAELAVAQQAPGVTSLGTRFYAEVAAGDVTTKNSSRITVKAAVLANHFVPCGESVEVDVVAHQGRAWIEVKAYEPFDLASTQWLGNPGHYKGLEQQAEQQLHVARSDCQRLLWQQPLVIFHFPQGVHRDVERELQGMGVLVSGPGAFCSSVLPPLPPQPAVCNLDVTTMCALVSEVSNGDPARSSLQQWAQRVTHWKECLSAEAQAPMLAMLQPVLADMKLIAADSAVHQFEKLLNQFGGKEEHARWLDLKNELTVFCNAQHQADVQAHEDKGCLPENGASSSLQDFLYSQTDSRVASLQAMSASQKDVFALGDLQRALTLTANGRATDFAARQGVRLAVFIHRAVWLTGM